MQKVQKQQGFTLIELIIVIIILGILAVTAAPRFLDLSGDATTATLEGVEAALQGGSQLVYARAAIDGVQAAATDTTEINGEDVPVAFGYPDADDTDVTSTIDAWLELDTTNDWTLTLGTGSAAANSPAAGALGIAPADATAVNYTITAADGNSCHVLYQEATDENDSPTISIVSGSC